ncbi:MAG: hypothetical protein MPJ24_11610 [Pirellulaceae bacterium]|nr:hypothetical protein [Pirellulaceae bacterium]
MYEDELKDETARVERRNDCSELIDSLMANLSEAPEDWGNDDLDKYLDGFAKAVENIDDYYQKHGITGVDSSKPSWRLFAYYLLAAADLKK